MKTIIRQIIEADKAARNLVDQAKSERQKAREMMTFKREEIDAELLNRSQNEIDQKKAELKAQLGQEKAISQERFEASLKAMQCLFEEKREIWVEQILQHCLDG